MVCNLIVVKECDFGKLKNEHLKIKLSQESRYPLSDDSVVYGFESKSVTVEDSTLIELYKENKRFISYFLFTFHQYVFH